ncbi:hypothetical protein EFB08_18960 [Rufibacter latericius]|uniref:Uncharacterized protein n=1 Tax=Rufibacter latericius TaxID=2487040 RepID=A0A3M9MEQ3_9BACT|nr:hypothetical protein EFB08_18960 [Rufibacter latericius]
MIRALLGQSLVVALSSNHAENGFVIPTSFKGVQSGIVMHQEAYCRLPLLVLSPTTCIAGQTQRQPPGIAPTSMHYTNKHKKAGVFPGLRAFKK